MKKKTLKELRMEHHLTIDEVVAAIHMPRKTYEKAESNATKLSSLKAYHLAKLYHVKLEDIDFGFEPNGE